MLKHLLTVFLMASLLLAALTGCGKGPDVPDAETPTETEAGSERPAETEPAETGKARIVLDRQVRDDKVTVSVRIDSESGLCAFDANLLYSPTALTFLKSAGEEEGQGRVCSAAPTVPGTVTLSWASLEPAAKGEVLFELEFSIASGGDSFGLSLDVQTLCDGELNAVPYEIVADSAHS